MMEGGLVGPRTRWREGGVAVGSGVSVTSRCVFHWRFCSFLLLSPVLSCCPVLSPLPHLPSPPRPSPLLSSPLLSPPLPSSTLLFPPLPSSSLLFPPLPSSLLLSPPLPSSPHLSLPLPSSPFISSSITPRQRKLTRHLLCGPQRPLPKASGPFAAKTQR